LEGVANDREVKRSKIRAYRHEAAAVYWDMTPLLVFMAMLFIRLQLMHLCL
jgi:hypothetical protein